jgi:membrane-bound serine protease (ClpP class)
MQDFVIPSFDWEWALLGRNVLVVFVGLLAAISGIAVIALIGPKIRIFDRLTLKAQITGTAGGPNPDSPAPEDEENFAALAGKIGTTDSILRPSGRALIDGKIYTVEADGEFVDSGRGIIVTRVRGNRIIVRRV